MTGSERGIFPVFGYKSHPLTISSLGTDTPHPVGMTPRHLPHQSLDTRLSNNTGVRISFGVFHMHPSSPFI
jgi:hypothetical protein